MDNLVKLIEENKHYSHELKMEVLPVSVVKEIIENLYDNEFNKALNEIKSAVKEVNQSIKSIVEESN